MNTSTRIAFATDVHRDGRISQWLRMAMRDYDVAAIGGDLDDPYSGIPNFKLNYVMHKLRPNVVRDMVLGFASKNEAKPIIVVLGNHDNPDARAYHGRSIAIAGLVVGGVGGSLPTGSPFPFQLDEAEYDSILKKMGHVDVLVVHQPPYGTKCDVAYHGGHAGSKAVRAYIDRESPRVVLTGHIHESPAVDQVGATTILNPGTFFKGNYGEVELTKEGAQARIMDVESGKPW